MKIDKLIRSSRKTIAIIVERDGQLVVRAPLRASNAQILRFVEEKSAWIRAKQEAAWQRKDQAAPHQFANGESFLYLGQSYPLKWVEIVPSGSRAILSFYEGRFWLAKASLPRAKEILTLWYKQQARQVLDQRVRLYASQFHLSFSQVKITSARTRWGSCSTRGTLSFTWRLVMAPQEVIDYVVIHELAHLLEKNHSKRFWDQVAAMLPDFQQQEKWLKQNGHRLNLE